MTRHRFKVRHAQLHGAANEDTCGKLRSSSANSRCPLACPANPCGLNASKCLGLTELLHICQQPLLTTGRSASVK